MRRILGPKGNKKDSLKKFRTLVKYYIFRIFYLLYYNSFIRTIIIILFYIIFYFIYIIYIADPALCQEPPSQNPYVHPGCYVKDPYTGNMVVVTLGDPQDYRWTEGRVVMPRDRGTITEVSLPPMRLEPDGMGASTVNIKVYNNDIKDFQSGIKEKYPQPGRAVLPESGSVQAESMEKKLENMCKNYLNRNN